VTTVNSTTPTTATTATGSSSSTSPNNLVGSQTEFLQLFMAQLQNQDPLNPQNGADMVAQLAQFSSVEQETETNTNLQNLTAADASNANASLSSLVGRTCDAGLGSVTIDDSTKIPPINVSSTGPISGASVVVTDANGKQVANLPIPANGGTVQWNGLDSSGNPVAAGNYTVTVSSGSTVNPITANWHDNIDSVQLTGSGSELRMGGILVTPSDITSIGGTAATSPLTTAAAALAAVSATQGASS
jgi:flagellar basal-body rod modification protein FlgD